MAVPEERQLLGESAVGVQHTREPRSLDGSGLVRIEVLRIGRLRLVELGQHACDGVVVGQCGPFLPRVGARSETGAAEQVTDGGRALERCGHGDVLRATG